MSEKDTKPILECFIVEELEVSTNLQEIIEKARTLGFEEPKQIIARVYVDPFYGKKILSDYELNVLRRLEGEIKAVDHLENGSPQNTAIIYQEQRALPGRNHLVDVNILARYMKTGLMDIDPAQIRLSLSSYDPSEGRKKVTYDELIRAHPEDENLWPV